MERDDGAKENMKKFAAQWMTHVEASSLCDGWLSNVDLEL